MGKIHISVPARRRPVRRKIRGVVIHRSRGLVAEWQPPWHLPRTTAEGRWRDTRRDNANLTQGTRTLRYGWPDVTEYRCRTAAEVAEVLRRQGWTGTLRRCGPACTATGPPKLD